MEAELEKSDAFLSLPRDGAVAGDLVWLTPHPRQGPGRIGNAQRASVGNRTARSGEPVST